MITPPKKQSAPFLSFGLSFRVKSKGLLPLIAIFGRILNLESPPKIGKTGNPRPAILIEYSNFSRGDYRCPADRRLMQFAVHYPAHLILSGTF
jgi:hypothetical protein